MSEKQTHGYVILSTTVGSVYGTVFTMFRPTTTLTTSLCLKALPIFHGEARYLEGRVLRERGLAERNQQV